MSVPTTTEAVPTNLWDLPTAELPPILLSIDQAARLLTVSRWKIFELIRLRELRSVKVGGSRRISAMALRDYVQRLEREGGDR